MAPVYFGATITASAAQLHSSRETTNPYCEVIRPKNRISPRRQLACHTRYRESSHLYRPK